MSLYDYEAAKALRNQDVPFYALLMAAMIKAETHNTVLLKAVFPSVWDEVQQRYYAPGGKLDGDDEPRDVAVVAGLVEVFPVRDRCPDLTGRTLAHVPPALIRSVLARGCYQHRPGFS